MKPRGLEVTMFLRPGASRGLLDSAAALSTASCACVLRSAQARRLSRSAGKFAVCHGPVMLRITRSEFDRAGDAGAFEEGAVVGDQQDGASEGVQGSF